MAPSSASKSKGRQGSNDLPTNAEMSAAADALSAKLSRKRTKTGCLTCRKRRIKCGEERPVCRNCIKSKRQCEGYAQRVVFKPPTFDYRQVENGAAHITFHAGPLQGPPDSYPYHEGYPINGIDASHGAYQYVPVDPFHPGIPHSAQHLNHALEQQRPLPAPVFYPDQIQAVPADYAPNRPQSQQNLVGAVPATYQHISGQNLDPAYSAPVTYAVAPPVESTPQPHQQAPAALIHANGQPDWPQQHMPSNGQKWQHSSPTTTATVEKVSPLSAQSSNTIQWNSVPTSQEPWSSDSYAAPSHATHPVNYQVQPITPQLHQQPHERHSVPDLFATHDIADIYQQGLQQVDPSSSPTHLLTRAAVETQDDDYYDVEPEEMETEISLLSSVDRQRQQTLNTILQMNNISIQDLQTRRYDTFIYDGIMTHYKAEQVASPLRNPATARVFAHFISVTGPSLSIYERHPINTSVLFTPGEIPFSQQGLWTYTMPMAALHHQGLLHAMLALASLHIARLQNASLTPSMQHYAWSLKRIHSCVSNAKKRYKLTTIAATMLLGFYEIMTADHLKWNTHLAGSKQLFLETDFVTMSGQFRRLKTEKHVRGGHLNNVPPQIHARDEILDQIHDVDDIVVSEFSGRVVRYDDHGRIVTQGHKIPPELDLGRFQILRDLYWWYLKQDAYQSIISGNPLLLDYSKWTNCPPRAPLGRLDAVYGTFDHLILLLGRIADFAARDRVRKLKQIEANGGQWIPPPWYKISAPPQQPPPATPVSASDTRSMGGAQFPPSQPPPQMPQMPQMPQFYGMAPPPRDNVRMPASYLPFNNLPTPEMASPEEFSDLAAAKAEATEEYGKIRAALHAFEASLGDGFQPLEADYYPPMATPFGESLQYRSYDIGCLWAIFHMASIIAIRSQPDMHPAAHVSAGFMASETRNSAIKIGQITSGIVPPAGQPLNPTLGSSLCESCMPTFFAAIQYHDPAQRSHTVTRIYDIAQRTGWGSAELIAHGCETAWVKAAQMGRGPPYTRVLRTIQSEDPRKNGSWERVDPNAAPDETNEADRRFVTVKPNARLTWAIGIMGTEEDEKLSGLNLQA